MRSSTAKKTIPQPSYFTEEIIFTRKEAKISGRLYLPQKGAPPFPILILSCGIGGRKDWFDPVFPEALCSRGVALFTYDMRGHCPSSGKMDHQIAGDMDYTVRLLAARKEIDPSRVLIGGQCLGGIVANFCAALNRRIRAVVNISLFLPRPVTSRFTRKVNDLVMAEIEQSSTHSADIDSDSFFELFAGKLDVVADARAISPRPHLIIHYKDDPVCPVSLVYDFYKENTNPEKRLIILTSEHTTWISRKPHAISYDDPRIAQRVAEWIERNCS